VEKPNTVESVGNAADQKKNEKLVGSGIAIAIFILIVYVCADSNGCSEFKYPASVLDHKIVVTGSNSELDVTLKLRGGDAGAVDLYGAIVDMESVMKHELKENGGEQGIVFHVVGDAGGGYDDYGHESPTHLIKAFDIQYSMENLRQIDWDHLPSENRLLNLGQISEITPAGVAVAQGYCKEAREYAQVFCGGF